MQRNLHNGRSRPCTFTEDSDVEVYGDFSLSKNVLDNFGRFFVHVVFIKECLKTLSELYAATKPLYKSYFSLRH